MDAVRKQVEGAQSALATAIAKAGLAADPIGQALQALSLTLGAQLSIHDAAIAHFDQVTGRLDQAVIEAVEQGETALNVRRQAIVEALAPAIADITKQSVRSWNRAVTARTLAAAAGCAMVGLIACGALCYGAGWKAGEASGINDRGALAGAVAQAGSDAEAVLVQLVRNNNLPGVIADCHKNSYMQDGRRACVIPIWLDPGKAPKLGG